MTRKLSRDHLFVRGFVMSALLALSLFLLASCSSSSDEGSTEESTGQSSGSNQMEAVHSMGTHGNHAIAGISWSIPDGWVTAGERPMRVETYFIDTVDTKAECAVYYFGPEQGGAVSANINRWINQMEMADGSSAEDAAMRGTIESDCCEISTVEVAGTYNFSAGPMMKTQEQRPDYLLLGAVVNAPEGSVFFKLTGPKAESQRFKMQFEQMLKSIKKS